MHTTRAVLTCQQAEFTIVIPCVIFLARGMQSADKYYVLDSGIQIHPGNATFSDFKRICTELVCSYQFIVILMECAVIQRIKSMIQYPPNGVKSRIC